MSLKLRSQEKLDIIEKRDFSRWFTEKVYGENAVWMRQWEVWKGVFKEVGKKLAKIKVSFPEEKP